jgi:periplasmic divalent cation tolerance protein
MTRVGSHISPQIWHNHMNNIYFIVLCTCPDEAVASKIAKDLVLERLAACVNRLGPVGSTYFWEGQLLDDQEVLLIIKTSKERLANLTARIEALHPYEAPEVVAIEVAGGSERYLAWLGQTLAG